MFLMKVTQFACVLLLATTVSAITVSIPLSASSAAPTLSRSLISLSIEQDIWPLWAGTTSTNSFFYNTLNNLKQITGEAPWIRIGANSEDHTDFSTSVKYSQTIFPEYNSTKPYPEATNITVGDGFYQIASHLPSNTHVIWGVNFGQNNITAAYLETISIMKAFASSAMKSAGITLNFLEIGNESDLYKKHGLRNSNYSVANYVDEWTMFATNVTATAKLSKTSHTKLLSGAFSQSCHTTGCFSPQGILAQGILSSNAGSLVTAYSGHHYSGSFCHGNGDLLQNLMTKSSIRGNLTQFSSDISAVHAKGLDYILGETNSYACHGAPGVSNVAGAALWALDYSLYAAQIGISRLFFHEGIGYKYNLIQPVALNRSITDGSTLASPLPAHVQPQYYSAIIAAEAIGPTGLTRSKELVLNDPHLAGYAFYENGVLVRALFINLLAYLSGATARNSTHIDMAFTGSGSHPSQMTIKRLAIKHADDSTGITWGGQTYETRNGKVSGTLKVTTSWVSVGIDIKATEVVLVNFL